MRRIAGPPPWQRPIWSVRSTLVADPFPVEMVCMTGDLTFVDTNILVYAYDLDAGEKHEQAKEVVVGLWRTHLGAVSIQGLQEFYVTVTRKLPRPMTKSTAQEVVATYEAWPVYSPRVADLIIASELEARHRLSFWDALIIVAARECGATTLLSEDLHSGQRIAGLTVVNPLRGS